MSSALDTTLSPMTFRVGRCDLVATYLFDLHVDMERVTRLDRLTELDFVHAHKEGDDTIPHFQATEKEHTSCLCHRFKKHAGMTGRPG